MTQQHDNYENPCRVAIYKGKSEDTWTLRYEDEGYEYYCSQEELLNELSEHMDNMKGETKVDDSKLNKAVCEIMELIKLLENDMEVITDSDDYKQRLYEIDGLYDALKILGGETAGEVY